MHLFARRSVLFALAAAALSGIVAGCGSSTSGSTGSMSVHLVDAPGDYLHVSLDVQSIQIQSGSAGWITLGEPKKVIDLLALVNGVSEALADGATLPAGHYDQMRLVLGTDNTVTLSDGTVVALKVPSGSQSGLKLPVSFDVAAGTTKDVFIDFDAHKSVFVHEAGRSGKYMLRPVVRAVDRVVTGSVSGHLTDSATHAPLAGAVITAQQLDSSGTPVVIRTALTQADGSYQLDLLPVNGSYYVVSQPVVGATSYQAKASGPVSLTAGAPLPTVDLAFDAASVAGTIGGSVTPAAGDADADAVVVRQSLDAGNLDVHPFIVRVAVPSEASGVETWSADALPAGSYALRLDRRTVAADGSESTTSSASADATVVAANAPVTVDFTLP